MFVIPTTFRSPALEPENNLDCVVCGLTGACGTRRIETGGIATMASWLFSGRRRRSDRRRRKRCAGPMMAAIDQLSRKEASATYILLPCAHRLLYQIVAYIWKKCHMMLYLEAVRY
eukprot:6172386-Pleurochrysis_carterae.AAC.1